MTAKLLQLPPPVEKSSKLWDSLAEWRATDDVPAALIQNLPALRAEGQAALVPATAQEMAVFLEMLQQTAAALRWPGLATGAARIYVSALGDVPADLLALALKRLERDWKWPRMPAPADIREAIKDELGSRKLRVTRLRTVEIFGGRR